MRVEWAGLSPDLLLEVDRSATTPLRAQLEDQLRSAVRSGRLGAGERMPSSRVLARQLALSRGLVQDCYAQLQAEGYLTSVQGAGTRVAATVATRSEHEPRTSVAKPATTIDRHRVADFASGVPDLGLVPREDWAWAVREACRTAPNEMFDYGDPQGLAQFREVVSAYLRRVRAVDTHAGQVVACGGFAQGLRLVLTALVAAGFDRVATEDPGSLGTVGRAASLAGTTMVPVPVDGAGLDVAALDRTGARIVVLTPAHQWPTGIVLAPERRAALLAWARSREAVIVEDDYDAEFRYDREPVGSMQGLAPEHVVVLGTVSKSLAPALRLGWAVVPAGLVEAVTAAKQDADRGTPALDQLALALLMESGRYDRHLRRMRTEYGRRREALVAAVGAHAPDLQLTGLAAGFHAVLHLPAGVAEQEVVAEAAGRGVGVYGMSTYRSTGSTEPGQLVMGFGNTGERAIGAGIAALAPVLSPALRAGSSSRPRAARRAGARTRPAR